MLRTDEIKTLRTITDRSLRDRIRNEQIRKECGVKDAVTWGRKKTILVHINRMNEERLVRIALGDQQDDTLQEGDLRSGKHHLPPKKNHKDKNKRVKI